MSDTITGAPSLGVPQKLTGEMISAARRAKINGTNLEMADWVEAASQQDLIDIGGDWPASPWDRAADVQDQVHEILLQTWWTAMLAAAPPSEALAQALAAAREEGRVAGLDEAARIADATALRLRAAGPWWREAPAREVAKAIRALISSPTPAQTDTAPAGRAALSERGGR